MVLYLFAGRYLQFQRLRCEPYKEHSRLASVQLARILKVEDY